jgi:hypothetical protein
VAACFLTLSCGQPKQMHWIDADYFLLDLRKNHQLVRCMEPVLIRTLHLPRRKPEAQSVQGWLREGYVLLQETAQSI